MGGRERRKVLLVGLASVLVLGLIVYLKLWTIDYSISSDDTEMLRRQFDLANREAMDESAEWRLKYDIEAEKALKCTKELIQMKDSFSDPGSTRVNHKLEMLQKENAALLKKLETTFQELEVAKLSCSNNEELSRYIPF